MSNNPRLADGEGADGALSETTPLLRSLSSDNRSNDERGSHRGSSCPPKPGHWATIVSLTILCASVILILLFGFFFPQAMEDYAVQAATVRLDGLVPQVGDKGVKATVKCTFMMDASRVESKSIRNIGRFWTWVAREAESEQSTVKLILPGYGESQFGIVRLPKIKVNIRNGHQTDLEFDADVKPPTDGDIVRQIADDWFRGGLGALDVRGEATVKLRSGIIKLPTQTVIHEFKIASNQIPSTPEFNITKLNFHEGESRNGKKGMAADATVTLPNDTPLELDVPTLRFSLMVENCEPSDPHITLADAIVEGFHIPPKATVAVDVDAFVPKLPNPLTTSCPGSDKSPLDMLLGRYMHGKKATIYIKGADLPSDETPKWLADLASSIIAPVPFPGRTFDNLIRNFSLTEVQFSLPDPLSDPDTPEGQPSVSANVNSWIALPKEMNFPIDVYKVRADADVYYHGRKLGKLDLHKWQDARSTRVEPPKGENQALLHVESSITDVPLEITDDETFSRVMQDLLFGQEPVMLDIRADVDVQVTTTLGDLTVRQIPANGTVPIKPILPGNKGLEAIKPGVKEITVLDSTAERLVLQVRVAFRNPTEYEATIPWADVKVLTNETMLGHATVRNANIVRGKNNDTLVELTWHPKGESSRSIGREFLSQFISGYNATITVKPHEGTIPSHPNLGRALSSLNLTIPLPHFRRPKVPDDDDSDDPKKPGNDDDDDDTGGLPAFLKDAEMHLLSSTPTFSLHSPLTHTPLYLSRINGSAYYKGSLVGGIIHPEPLAVPPGESTTPKLPVEWSLGSVGYDAVKKALGGHLRLRACANVTVGLGEWSERVWFVGRGVGARVRL